MQPLGVVLHGSNQTAWLSDARKSRRLKRACSQWLSCARASSKSRSRESYSVESPRKRRSIDASETGETGEPDPPSYSPLSGRDIRGALFSLKSRVQDQGSESEPFVNPFVAPRPRSTHCGESEKMAEIEAQILAVGEDIRKLKVHLVARFRSNL